MTNTPETEAVKKLYVALNNNDIPAVLKLVDPEIERIEFEGTPMAGVFRGLSEFSAHVTKGRSTWAEGSCEPEQLISEGDKVIVHVHVRVRLKNKTEWIDGRTCDIFTFRNGKIIEMRTFLTAEEAFAWVRSGHG